ncbi:lanthionine synthetase C family protein [Natronosporangium hydrolyticum]|nr:lanthionine synthetase C family protein [Natronosporangium hydrolyticum]
MTGTGGWATAHEHIRQVTAGPVDAAAHTGLFYGAPTVAFLLHTAGADGKPRYRQAAATLDRHILHLTRQRVADANERIDHGENTRFSEYDLLYGLTGIGALLLRHLPGSDTLADLLHYLVRLTGPHPADERLPGWWVAHDPDPLLPTPGGHANLGMAHGAAGLLALLALATRSGVLVDGQREAIDRLLAWFDTWRQDGPEGPWWPQWLTRDELRTGRAAQPGPGRPSWCYGTPGIARALQLAAIATGDQLRQRAAEDALAGSISAPRLQLITEPGLCHGAAGLYQTISRAAHDAANPTLRRQLPALADRLAQHSSSAHGDGLLTGSAGLTLALETARNRQPPRSGWDACLLIS